MKASLIPQVLLVAAIIAGCASTPSAPQRSGTPAASPASFKALDALAAAGQHDALVAQAEAMLSRETDPQVRAGIQVRRAKALQASEHPRSAVIGFQHALDELPNESGALAAQILQAWGDTDASQTRWRDALVHYGRAFDAGPADGRTRDDLVYSGYVAAREAGDKTAMAAWKSRVRVFSPSHLAAVETRLLPPRPPEKPVAAAPVAVLAPGAIPDDPTLLLSSIHRRADWSAAPVRDNVDPMLPVTHVTVHHSAMPSIATRPADVAGELREIQGVHQKDKGWADIGYHFVIDAGGGVWEGRPLRYQGAHEGAGLNRGAIGVCLLGNFDETPVPEAQQQALGKLLDALCKHFSLGKDGVRTHQEVRLSPTDCPGRALQQYVDAYRRGAAAVSVARQ
jgi:N-acetylmuramoyl-L-alanine amidase